MAEDCRKEYINQDGDRRTLVSEITGTWEAVTKDADGVAHIHKLKKHSIKERPLPDKIDLEKALVRRAPSVIIRPSRRKRSGKVTEEETLVFGDAQVPFGDRRAMALAQMAVRELMPDNVVFVGDMIDLPSQSKYDQRPEWAGTTQSAIDSLHSFYAQIRADAPDSNIYVVHGNHEKRLDDYVRRNATEVLGLRRANMAHELAVLSLRYLLRYEDLDIRAIDGYPNGTLWLEDNLKFVHGTNTKKGGANAAKYLSEEPESTIYGHSHRQELAYRTIPTRDGQRVIAASSPGALCSIDGTVPGFNHTVDSEGQIIKKAEDWQQGLLQIHHEGLHHEITPVLFSERGMILNGKRYGDDSPS